jgi:hypothetical protein
MKYILEVYPPDDPKTPDRIFSSDAPFGSIHKGDLFNAVISPQMTWRVTEVEHIVWGGPDLMSHKIMIHTEAAKASY